MIIDGRAISRELLETVREETRGGAATVLRAITVAPDAATQSYLRIKKRAAETAGMTLEVVELPETATSEECIAAIIALGADAVIVQLPLPPSIDEARVLAAISPELDADVLSPAARVQGTSALVPPVAAAVEEILARGGVEVPGAIAVVIGKGKLVGAPVAERLTALGAHVSSYDEHDFDPAALASAQIIVSGAGVPGLIRPEMLSPGVALIDAGTSEQGGALVGDADPACKEVAGLFTPVPGGVGPITVACLLRNAAELRKRRV